MNTCPFTGEPCEKPRNVSITDVVKGKAVSSVEVCVDCAVQFINSGTTIIEQIQTMLKQKSAEFVQSLFSAAGHEHPKVPQCPHCGWSIMDIRKEKKMGCSGCYEFFDVSELLVQMHGADKHTGKKPQAQGEKPVATKTETLSEVVSGKIAESQAILRQAVEDENYAKAAKMRDLIRTLAPILERAEEYETRPSGTTDEEMRAIQEDYDKAVNAYG